MQMTVLCKYWLNNNNNSHIMVIINSHLNGLGSTNSIILCILYNDGQKVGVIIMSMFKR